MHLLTAHHLRAASLCALLPAVRSEAWAVCCLLWLLTQACTAGDATSGNTPDRPLDYALVVTGDVAERRFVALYGRGGRLVGALGWNRPRHIIQWRQRLAEGMDYADAVALARSEP